MPDREKLIELTINAFNEANHICGSTDCNNCAALAYPDRGCVGALIANILIANGVTIQRWIPVEEELPETLPCGAGTAYSEAVNVLTTGRKVLVAVFDGEGFIADAEFWEAEDEEITHWMPLPQPPKGE